MVCNNCGKQVDPSLNFCGSCGMALNGQTTVLDQNSYAAPQPEPQYQPQPEPQYQPQPEPQYQQQPEPQYQQQPEPQYQQQSNYQYQQQGYQYQQQHDYQQGYYQQATNSVPSEYTPITPWGYLLYGFLFNIPLVGFIMLIVYSFSKSNLNLRNFARSYWCAMLLAILLCIILLIISLFVPAVASVMMQSF